MSSIAKLMVEDGHMDMSQVTESRRAYYSAETDMVHKCKDGSFVYEENWFDWDDQLGKARNFRQLSRALPAAWKISLPMEEDYCDWQDAAEQRYMEELELEDEYE